MTATPLPPGSTRRTDWLRCLWCGDEFSAGRPTIRFCGQHCRDRCRSHRKKCAAGDNCTTHARYNGPGRGTPPDLDRILARVDMSGGPEACWEWTGPRKAEGYGLTWRWADADKRERKTVSAHRFVFMLMTGQDLDPDVLVLHSCDNPPCCNPAHLRAGTHVENMLDMKERGRSPRGAAHCNAAQLGDEDVADIRARYKRYVKGRGAPALGAEYGVSRTIILAVVQRTGRWAEEARA
jgi:hypothetical protein